jgi:Flp pilus assembly protein TadG
MRVARSFVAGSRRCRGGAAIELAVLLPLLVVLVLGCVDFGRFAYTYIAVTNAARAGAGFASNHPYTTATYTTWQSQTQQAVSDEIGALSGFSVGNVTVTATTETSGLWRAQVTVPCTFQTLMSWPGIPSQMTLQQSVIMRGIR